MTWTVPTQSAVDGPLTGDDRPILEGFLNWQRATLRPHDLRVRAAQRSRRPAQGKH
jgi:hypothetical protein